MNIGAEVYFESQGNVVSGEVIAIDVSEPMDHKYVVNRRGKLHYLMAAYVFATTGEAGAAMIQRLRRDRIELRKVISRKQDDLEALDERITNAIRTFK